MPTPVRLSTLAITSAFLSPLAAQCVSPGAQQFSTLYQGTTYLGAPDPVYGANMLFDLQCNVDVTITGLALNLFDGPGPATNPNLNGETSDVVIWTVPTTWVGNNTVGTGGTVPATPPGWTQVGAGIMTIAAPNQPSVVVLNAPFTLLAGTYGVAIQHLPTIPSLAFPNPERVHPLYTNPASAAGTPTVWSDQFMTLTAGAGQGSAFTSGVAQPRVINCDIDYAVGPNTAYTTTYGLGCYDRPRSFYENFPAPGSSDLNSVDLVYQQGSDNYLIAQLNTQMVPYNQPGAIHVNAAAPGLSGTGGTWDDANSVPISLPASWGAGFPFPTGVTNAIEINSNGVVWLGVGSTRTAAFYGGVTAMLNGTAALIGCYGDWEPANIPAPGTGSGDIFVDVGPGDSYVAVTWVAVAEWNVPGSSSTFQIVMHQGGNVTYVHSDTSTPVPASVAMVAAEMMCGFTPGNGSPDPGSVNIDTLQQGTPTGDGTLPPVLTIDARPVGGTTVNLTTDGLHPNTVLTATFLGFASLPGVDLTNLGVAAPGCLAHINPAAAFQLGLGIGTTPHVVPFPVPVGFVGLNLYAQTAQVVPGMNPAGVTTSNAICLSLGSQ